MLVTGVTTQNVAMSMNASAIADLAATANSAESTIATPLVIPEPPAFGTTVGSSVTNDALNIAPVEPTDLWDRIRTGFGMNASDSPLVETHINWYAQRPNYISRMMERSRRYLFHILVH